MNKLIITLILFPLFFSCQKKKVELNNEIQSAELVDSIPKPKYAGDSLFCQKMLTFILNESKKWPVNYEFKKLDWQIKDKTRGSDFDFIPYVQKEVHFYAKDPKNAFSRIEVDYYVLQSEEIAKKIIKGYASELSDIGNIPDSIFYSRAYIKIPTYLYRFGATILQVKTDNGVAHIVTNALSDFNEQENIDKNDAVPYMEPRKKKNKK